MRSSALCLLVLSACGTSAAHDVPVAVTPPKVAPPPPAPAPACVPAPAAPAADEEREDFAARATPSDPKDVCAVADSNLARVEDAILAWPTATPAPAARAPSGAPATLGAVARRLALSPGERARLLRDGLVVPARLEEPSYVWAFHEIYQSELPVFIGVDAILHAVYAGHDHLVADLERRRLAPELGRLLEALACALPAAPYPSGVARDLDLYLTVARSLDAGAAVPGALRDPEVDAAAANLVAQALEARGLEQIELFGRPRMVDFSQLRPRGHYAGDAELERYFRAAMWLMRLELNLVSRSSRSSAPGLTPDPRETPREAALALALADLVARAGALPALDSLDGAFAALAGRREDVSVRDLLALHVAGFDDDAAARLRAAIGDRFQRRLRMHVMPPGSTELPAIATLLGPRAVADAEATRPLVHAELPGRYRLGAPDFAYLLGHDRALRYLGDDLARFPALAQRLRSARALVAGAADPGDLYTAWLGAIRGLAERPAGVTPRFMTTDAFADLRLDSAVAAYAQLRHDHVLVVGQPYDEGGCDIPDGWVEPAPAVYRGLIEYARRGAAALPEARPYFERQARVLSVLLAIQELELAGRPLPPEARQFLAMVVEMTPATTGSAPTYTGWWFDLFEHRVEDGLKPAALLADVYTSSNDGISYVGAGAPRLGVFVVDTGGPARVVVGPVARGFGHHGPLDQRLDDAAGAALSAAEREEPWAASYTVPAPPAPALTLRYSGEADRVAVELDAGAPLTATVEILDHHRRPLARTTRAVTGRTVIPFPARHAGKVEAVHVAVGAWNGWAIVNAACDCAELGTAGADAPRD
jgi:hypothetical protein